MQRVSKRCAREMAGRGSEGWSKLLALAKADGVINLGQGFPDFMPNIVSSVASIEAKNALDNCQLCQYSPQIGIASLRQAVATMHQINYEQKLDPETMVSIMSSGTEAIYATMQGLVNPGDEVIVFEPCFPWYLPAIRMAGGIPRIIRLHAPSFEVRQEDLKRAFNERTKVLLVNTPHNPTGHMANREELVMLATLCERHNVVCVSDEVYEICAFDPSKQQHVAMSQVSKWAANSTITIGSASKLLSLTGWRIGWVTGPEDLVKAVTTAHSYMSFCAPTPLQVGVGAALNSAVKASKNRADIATKLGDLGPIFGRNWKILADALVSCGLLVCPAQGGYFLVADIGSTGFNDVEFCTWLVTRHKIAAMPLSLFYAEDLSTCTLVRFAVCKTQKQIESAAAVLRKAGNLHKVGSRPILT